MATFTDFHNLRVLWNYMKLHERPEPCDAILALGSHDDNVAKRATELFKAGYSNKIIFSGGIGRVTKDYFVEPEADRFSLIAMSLGVPKDAIFIENQSQNTGENFQFTDDLIHEKGLEISTLLVITKPASERRIRATFDKQMPRYKGIITSPTMSFKDYMNYYYVLGFTLDRVINLVVGDVQRLMVYYYYGYQNFVDVPLYIVDTFNKLVAAGYDKNLV